MVKVGNQGAAVRAGLLLLLIGAVWMVCSCGERLDLPPQPTYQPEIPEPGTFNLRAVWSIERPGDLALSGIYLFVIEDHARVRAFFTTRLSPSPPAWVSSYQDLIAPVQVAVCKRDSLFVVVADSGDMRCKIFSYLGGAPLYSFTDSLWVEFSGLATDGNLNIYVADAARDTIQSYDRWGRRLRVVSDYGTGSGYVIDPHGLAHDGHMLIVADTGKNWVQRLRPDTTNIPAIAEPIGRQEGLLLSPLDVASDSRGEFIYVADTGQDRVLKFQTTGGFQDTVYSHRKISLEEPILAPRFVCGEDSLVFVSDPDNDRIVLLELKPL
ncbi:MAG: NHL repeat-containing protein [Candidatus Eisenbacteria bacterium]